MSGDPKTSGWRGHQRAQHPREGTAPVRLDASSSVKVDDRNPPSTSQRVDPCVLRARDSTGAVRAFSEAIGSSQAPSARRAVRLQGPQMGSRRAGKRTRQEHWVRGREAKNAPELAGEDVVVARRPTEDSNLAPPSYAGGVPPGKSQIHESGQRSAISACRHVAYRSHAGRARIMPGAHGRFL